MPDCEGDERQMSGTFPLNLIELERHAVMAALQKSNGNMSQAAELLGITRFALYRKIDKYGLE